MNSGSLQQHSFAVTGPCHCSNNIEKELQSTSLHHDAATTCVGYQQHASGAL
jgi:hypothetical protein